MPRESSPRHWYPRSMRRLGEPTIEGMESTRGGRRSTVSDDGEVDRYIFSSSRLTKNAPETFSPGTQIRPGAIQNIKHPVVI